MAEQDVVTQPHLFALPTKAPGQGPSSATPSLSSDAKQYVDGLEAARAAVAAALSSPSRGASAEGDAALRAYLSQLLALCRADLAAPDEATAAMSTSQAFLLRRALPFEWQEVYTASGSGSEQCGARDVAFEVAAVLQAAAAARMARAATLCHGQTPSAAALQGYKLLREAAGMLEVLQARVLPIMAACPSADLSREVVATLQNLALADAQTLALLRAIKKGHAPALVSSLASDTASLYAASLSALLALAAALGWAPRAKFGGKNSRPGPPCGDPLIDAAIPGGGSWPRAGPALKLAAYLQYKYAHCRATAFAYGALAALAAHEGGNAVALASEAVRLVRYVYVLANDYDRATPITSRSEHEEAERQLDKLAADTLKKATSDNNAIYLQPIPKTCPPLPEPKRAIEPLPFELPAPTPGQPSPSVVTELVSLVSGDRKLRKEAEAAAVVAGGSVAAAAAAAGAVAAGGAMAVEADGMMMMERPATSGMLEADQVAGANTLPASSLAANGAVAAATAGAAAAGVTAGATAPAPKLHQGPPPPPSAQPSHMQAAAATAPPKTPVATATTATGSGDADESGGCSFCRCLVTAICMPLLVLVSLIGIVVWIVLLPFKLCLCCCPIACLAQLIWNVVEWMIKAPLRWALWAAGKPHKPQRYPGRVRATGDVETGDKV